MGSDESAPPTQALPQHLTQMGKSHLSQDAIILLVCLFCSKNDIHEGVFYFYT